MRASGQLLSKPAPLDAYTPAPAPSTPQTGMTNVCSDAEREQVRPMLQVLAFVCTAPDEERPVESATVGGADARYVDRFLAHCNDVEQENEGCRSHSIGCPCSRSPTSSPAAETASRDTRATSIDSGSHSDSTSMVKGGCASATGTEFSERRQAGPERPLGRIDFARCAVSILKTQGSLRSHARRALGRGCPPPGRAQGRAGRCSCRHRAARGH